MPEEPRTPPGLLLCDDLLFASRVTATARSLGLEVQIARTTVDLLERARCHQPGGIILDLAFPDLALTTLLHELRTACPGGVRVIAYGSHVDTDSLRAARQAGCDPVLPRSKFALELPEQLASWLCVP
jgi:CheY-like chemotaxis protein